MLQLMPHVVTNIYTIVFVDATKIDSIRLVVETKQVVIAWGKL